MSEFLIITRFNEKRLIEKENINKFSALRAILLPISSSMKHNTDSIVASFPESLGFEVF